MNECRQKFCLGKQKEFKRQGGWMSGYVLPVGRTWK
jgi:hypothetical protein